MFTNGTLLDDNITEFLHYYNTTLILQVFDYTEEGYSYITNESWSYSAFTKALSALNSYKVDYSISVIASSLNESHLEEILDFFKERKAKLMYLYPTNEFHSIKLLEQMTDPKNKEININIFNYQTLDNYHNCLYGQIFISHCGEVYPCMMMRSDKLGNMIDEPLYKVFNEQRHKRYWNTPKKNMDSCDQCERSLFCFDCRALETFATQNFKGMRFCSKILNMENISCDKMYD